MNAPLPKSATSTAATTPYVFSQRAQKITSSIIREILKVTERPEVISFAGGLPSPETFPIEVMKDAFDAVLNTRGKAALQYGPTEGFMPLREWIAADLNAKGARVTAENILLVSGSQQALDLLGKVLINPGQPVLVETPTYLGALQAFNLFEPSYRSVASDDEGLVPDAITPELREGAAFLYALPNFQNPTGRTLHEDRRRALVQKAVDLNLLVIEDDPYGDLRYEGQPQPMLLSIAAELGCENVVRMGSFSKTLAPGLRLGYIAAPKALMNKLVQAKQATDLHTATISQMAVHQVVSSGFLTEHLPKIRALYKNQCSVMIESLREHLPAGVHFTVPEGGMFLWLTLPEGIDTMKLLDAAVAANVAFVPGAPFYANEITPNTLRLSFVTVPPEKIRAGVKVLAEVIKKAL
ncbi:PLP-dependent aminotransferase family protein [Piscinibacterium candidicorallinum]|uniref:PLP-dependent aminotransferase family protein n=1 Tax=Piscinibacterium candidicorallinum TaxID=1793872 RepID=A0ABV7H441_9BURK